MGDHPGYGVRNAQVQDTARPVLLLLGRSPRVRVDQLAKDFETSVRRDHLGEEPESRVLCFLAGHLAGLHVLYITDQQLLSRNGAEQIS